MDGGASTTPVYEIGSPLFEKITIHLDEYYYSGKKFVIEAKNTSKENRYIQSATLNGKALNTFWFYHKDLVSGGELILEMGASPNREWGKAGSLARLIDIDPIVTTPYVKSEERLFLDKMQISLACDTKGAKIYYTLDESSPDRYSLLFVKPFTIKKTSTIKMCAFVGNQSSLTATAVVEKANYQSAIEPGAVMPGISYNYYTGIFSRVSDFKNMPSEKSGILSHFSLEPRDKEQYFGFNYKGFIKIPSDGLYTFYLKSNDGSKMYLGGSELINNDGGHPVIERFETIALKAGYHEIIIKYFQEGGTHHLQLGWEGPGFKKEDVPADVLFYKN
jgi:hypothetical protein